MSRPLRLCVAVAVTATPFACHSMTGLDAYRVEQAGGDSGGGAGDSTSSSASGASGASGGSGGNGAATGGAEQGGGGTSNLPSCDDQYAASQECTFCTQVGDDCKLHCNNSLKSCAAVCEEHGGECLRARNDLDGQQCVSDPNDPSTCSYVGLASGICFCSRGCGMMPPCPTGQRCSGGVCS